MPQPNPNATSSTFQVGTYTSLTDTFTSVFDLNDGVNSSIMWNTLKLPQPEKAFVRSFNLRAPGERVTRFQYKNRHIQVSVSLRGSTVQAILNTCHNLIAAIENPPYRIRFSQPNATTYTYASVVAVTHNIPADPQTLLAKALPNVQIDFECLPGLLGDRVTLSNLVVNPGFEAPSGPAVGAFSDGFGSVNAYSLAVGSAPTLNPANTFVDVVMANGGANLLRYYRLGLADDATHAYDIAGTGATGTPTGSPTQGAGSLVSGDTDSAYTFTAASSQYVDCPVTGLPTGNSPAALGIRLKFSANPAANQFLITYGAAAGGAHNTIGLFLDSTGHINASVGAGLNVTSGVITTGANHSAVTTWDGTTLKLYVDGVSVGTPITPGAQTIPTSAASNRLRIAATADTLPAFFYNGQLDEAMVWNADIGATAIGNINTAASTGATGTVASAATFNSGSRVAFGSPSWGALNNWQVRLRYATSQASIFYLHYTDGSNNLSVQLAAGANGFKLVHMIAGVSTTLAQATVPLQHEAWYWLQVAQFPQLSIVAPNVQATLYYDDAGVVGSVVTNGAIGPVFTQDNVTALVGRPQITISGANCVIGGAFSGVHTVSLFGPGGWSYSGNNGGTGTASLGWDGGRPEVGMSGNGAANTYPNGPVTSQGAARIDCPPAGTPDARLGTWDGTGGSTGAAQYGIPTAQSHVLGLSVAYKTSAGLSATSSVSMVVLEYNSSGVQQGVTATLTVLSGTTQTSWATFSTTYTVLNAATAFVRVQLRVADTTAGSANQTVWFDNVQCWDQTTTGQTSMPYCELRFPQSPAQLLVSGILGDMPVPVSMQMATYVASWANPATLSFLVGRRGQATSGAVLTGNNIDSAGTAVLASTAFGGFYWSWTSLSNRNPNALNMPTINNASGAYRLIHRSLSQQVAGSIGNVTSSVAGITLGGGMIDKYQSAPNANFITQGAWTVLADAGVLSIPLFAKGATMDNNQTVTLLRLALSDPGSAAAGQTNWWMLLPTDGSMLGGIINNPANGGSTITAQWIWIYADGLNVPVSPGALGAIAWALSIEPNSQASPGHAVGGAGNITNGNINVNPVIEPYLTLDPTLTIAGTSVNQFAGAIADGTGSVQPFHAEIQYTPLYLYPR